MKTKEKILSRALLLFNNKGIENITTRHIASELGISQGNLHYHYPNKSVLIMALFNQFLNAIGKNTYYQPGELFTKETLLKSIRDNFDIMFHYRFLFKDNEMIWRKVPDIKAETVSLLQQKKSDIKAIINHYKTIHIFRTDISESQIEFLAEQFLFSISSWLVAEAYYNLEETPSGYFAKFIFRMWLPYLTPEFLDEWEAML